MIIDIAWIIFGFILLMGGADYLVRGSCELANRLGVPPLIIGLTIVAAGTSAPELFVSANAAFQGVADVAIGNVVGSNIFNILVIIGLAALIKPLAIAPAINKREMPLMLLSSALFVAFSMDALISRAEGLILCFGMLAYFVMNYVLVKRAPVLTSLDGIEEVELKNLPIWQALIFIVLGVLAMVFGSDYVVEHASSLAREVGVSDLVIGITLVAIGTSLPEVAATLAAARRNQAELALGNAIGSNLFNVLCVLGVTAALTPITVSATVMFEDNWIMLGACLLVFAIMRMRCKISRLSGAMFLCCYMVYMIWLASNHV